MSNTREKFSEAQYFFECMKKTQTNSKYFKYNLSAFLAAFRSVTWIMENEYRSFPHFNRWFQKQIKIVKRDDLMILLRDKRNLTIHQEPIKFSPNVKAEVHETLTLTDSVKLTVIHPDGTKERYDPAKKEAELPKTGNGTEASVNTYDNFNGDIQFHWYFDDEPDKDIFTLCREGLIKLERMIGECESKFKIKKL